MGCCFSKDKIQDKNAAETKPEADAFSDNTETKKDDQVNDSKLEFTDLNKDLETDNRTTTENGSNSNPDKQVLEWMSLIESLNSNSKLKSYALAKTRHQFKLVNEVGDYLAGCHDAKSKAEKAWIIYVWVTENIQYDEQSFRTGDFRFCDPQSVLERGLAVCAGYSELFKTLCTHLGVQCISISGYSKGYGYKVGQKMTREDHAWNAIALGNDGKLRFIDSTWGAGHFNYNNELVKEFVPYYFAVPAHIFNESHHSGSYTPTDGTKKFTLEEFENCPNNELGYHILGLTCVNNTMRAVTKTRSKQLVIEYASLQRIFFLVTLKDEKTGRKIEHAAFIQSEFSMFKEQKSKYCLIADIPEKGRNYKIQLFAKNKHSSEDEEKSYPMITEFLVVREGDEESFIPQYNLTFAHEIKLKSHYCQFIKFKTNPLVMEFEVPKHIKTLFKVKTMNDSDIEDAVFSQINPENSKTIVKVALPRKEEKFILQLFAKQSRDKGNMLGLVSQIFLIRTESNKNDELKFCKLFTPDKEFYIYSPFEYYLNEENIYEFRYFIRDALDVAIVDGSGKWTHLDKLNSEPNIWSLNTALKSSGKFKIFAKFDDGNSFTGICCYEIKETLVSRF